ncbi:MAG: hypothetical protein NXI10_11610 [bacterium]|nr:hypothetical protein [bacterium]
MRKTKGCRLLNYCYRSFDCFIFDGMSSKPFWKRYLPYFVDVWQYLVIIVIFIIALIFFL